MARQLTRSEMISFLSSMGVDIPPTSKLPDKSLRMRLAQTLNSVQQISTALPAGILYPEQLSSWRDSPVFDSIRRSNFDEVAQIVQARMEGKGDTVELYANPFLDLRQTIMGLAKNWDGGVTSSVLQNAEETSGILIRCTAVCKIDAQTPVMIVLYLPQTPENVIDTFAPWLAEARDISGNDDFALGSVKATQLEQTLLLTMLEQNSKYLSVNYKPRRLQSEEIFKLSFILPVGPLDMEGVGKLNKDTGCGICGKPIKSACASCRSVSYCSSECQKIDWPAHKATCKTLRDGTWHTIKFTTILPGFGSRNGQAVVQVPLNRFDSLNKKDDPTTISMDDTKPFPDIHGQKIFLVKFQVRTDELASPTSMMIYDRRRSFQAYYLREPDEKTFEQFVSQIRSLDSPNPGLKMYRYAQRVGDWDLRVCVDRAPTGSIQW